MLTAGYRQNNFRSPFHSLRKSIICSCVTGMQGYYHINRRNTFIISNISLIRMQFFISILYCKMITFFYYICFQIQTNNIYIITFQFSQIVIHGKCKIGLSASKIKNGHFPLLIQSWKNVLNKFQKSIDLSELIVFLGNNPAFLIHNTKINKKGDWNIFLKYVLLYTIVGQYLRALAEGLVLSESQTFSIFGMTSGLYGHLSFFAYQNSSIQRHPTCLKLRKIMLQPRF